MHVSWLEQLHASVIRGNFMPERGEISEICFLVFNSKIVQSYFGNLTTSSSPPFSIHRLLKTMERSDSWVLLLFATTLHITAYVRATATMIHT